MYNGIDCALDESEISNITSQLSTVVLNRTSQTENIKASSVLSDKPIEAVRALTYHNNLTSKPSSLDESEYLNSLSISDCTLSSTTEMNSVVEAYTESLKFSAKNDTLVGEHIEVRSDSPHCKSKQGSYCDCRCALLAADL